MDRVVALGAASDLTYPKIRFKVEGLIVYEVAC